METYPFARFEVKPCTASHPEPQQPFGSVGPALATPCTSGRTFEVELPKRRACNPTQGIGFASGLSSPPFRPRRGKTTKTLVLMINIRYITNVNFTTTLPQVADMKPLFLVAVVLAFASVSNAQPSPTVRYLMQEPVTLFDMGILRLHEYLDAYTAHSRKTLSVPDMYGTVRYDAVRSRILLNIVVTQEAGRSNRPPDPLQTSPREICRTLTQGLKREFLVDRDRLVRRSLGIYRFFAHIGFQGKNEPADAFEEIENITFINVSIYTDKDPGKLILQCESPLMGKDITYVGGE